MQETKGQRITKESYIQPRAQKYVELFTGLGDNILKLRDDKALVYIVDNTKLPKSEMLSGLILDNGEDRKGIDYQYGVVLAVGPGKWNEDATARIEPPAERGDFCLFHPLGLEPLVAFPFYKGYVSGDDPDLTIVTLGSSLRAVIDPFELQKHLNREYGA